MTPQHEQYVVHMVEAEGGDLRGCCCLAVAALSVRETSTCKPVVGIQSCNTHSAGKVQHSSTGSDDLAFLVATVPRGALRVLHFFLLAGANRFHVDRFCFTGMRQLLCRCDTKSLRCVVAIANFELQNPVAHGGYE